MTFDACREECPGLQCDYCCQELLLADSDRYEDCFLDIVLEHIGFSLDLDNAGHRRTVSECFRNRVRLAHVVQAAGAAKRTCQGSPLDPERLFRLAMSLVWTFVRGEPTVPRLKGTEWCLAEDEILLTGLNDELSLTDVASRLGCTSGAVFGRARRLQQYGAFPQVWLREWEEEFQAQ